MIIITELYIMRDNHFRSNLNNMYNRSRCKQYQRLMNYLKNKMTNANNYVNNYLKIDY